MKSDLLPNSTITGHRLVFM